MKRTFFYIMMAAALSACGHRASTADDAATDSADFVMTELPYTESVDSTTAKPALTIDTIRIERTDSMAEVALNIQWPTGGDVALTKSVRQFIRDVCGIKDEAFIGNWSRLRNSSLSMASIPATRAALTVWPDTSAEHSGRAMAAP